jgi:hypothetical protein
MRKHIKKDDGESERRAATSLSLAGRTKQNSRGRRYPRTHPHPNTMPPPHQPLSTWEATTAAARSTAASVSDRLFGTRTLTVGAARQLPRKTPLRIEPKTYFGE